MTYRVLFADDEAQILSTALRVTVGSKDLRIDTAMTPGQCLSAVEAVPYDLVMLDINFTSGRREGVQLISQVKHISPSSEIIMMSSLRDEETMAECRVLGATDFIVKSGENFARLAERLRQALTRQAERVSELDGGRRRALEVGATIASKAMAAVYGRAAVLRLDKQTNTLIFGQSGAGKEMVAKAASRQDDGAPYQVLNCACLSETLAASELFGHERGAFTGAEKDRVGVLELANGGDLFLDEVARLPLAVQPTLLRALQDGWFKRVGGTEPRYGKPRIIAATNEDLPRLVREGRFREDLWQRLAKALIEIPPLKDRPEDIPVLIARFIACSKSPGTVIDPSLMSLLCRYHWPRNVRELEDVVYEMIRFTSRPVLTVGDLPREIAAAICGQRDTGAPRSHLDTLVKLPMDEAEAEFRVYYIKTRAKAMGPKATVAGLAEAISVKRPTLARHIKDHRIELPVRENAAPVGGIVL